MKTQIYTILRIVFLAISPVYAQDLTDTIPVEEQEVITGKESEVRITSGISDSIASESAPEPEPIEFEVLRSNMERVYVVKSPEMSGLPISEGIISVTVQLVKDPGLFDPPPLVQAIPPDDIAVLARMEQLQHEEHKESQLVSVSATVYDHSRTLLHCYLNGGTKQGITLWSNLDFNHFCGISSFQTKDSDGELREYGLIMGIGNEEIQQRTKFYTGHGGGYVATALPQLADLSVKGPAFVIVEGDTTDRETIQLVTAMHNLYKVEGERMEAAYNARTKAYEERKAFLLANPPKPKDVTLRFWKRNEPSPQGLQAMEEAQP